MCGRYALYGPRWRSRAEREYFESLDIFPPRYNVAPTDVMPITILRDGVPVVVSARWGLVGRKAADVKSGARKIVAPCEKLTTWAEYRVPYRAKQRCLVPACGFYEWTGSPAERQPYYFLSPEHTLLAFAGLWEQWTQPDGKPLLSYTIITTEPNDLSRRFHDRMPVVLEEKDYGEWLTSDDPRGLLKPCHNEALINYPVSKRVNSVMTKVNGVAVKNDDPSLVEPIAIQA
ncbi:MAG: SOS response-associated peptidase [Rhodospirillaceae bacterium]